MLAEYVGTRLSALVSLLDNIFFISSMIVPSSIYDCFIGIVIILENRNFFCFPFLEGIDRFSYLYSSLYSRDRNAIFSFKYLINFLIICSILTCFAPTK